MRHKGDKVHGSTSGTRQILKAAREHGTCLNVLRSTFITNAWQAVKF